MQLQLLLAALAALHPLVAALTGWLTLTTLLLEANTVTLSCPRAFSRSTICIESALLLAPLLATIAAAAHRLSLLHRRLRQWLGNLDRPRSLLCSSNGSLDVALITQLRIQVPSMLSTSLLT